MDRWWPARFAPLQFQDGGVIGSGPPRLSAVRLGARLRARRLVLVEQGHMARRQMLPRSVLRQLHEEPGVGDPAAHGWRPGRRLSRRRHHRRRRTNQNILGQGSYGYNWTFNQPNEWLAVGAG